MLYAFSNRSTVFLQLVLTDGGMVSKATHTACYETQMLIGFINYTACYQLVRV